MNLTAQCRFSLVFSAAALLVSAVPASAQDMDPVPVGVDPPGGVTFIAAGNSAVDPGGEDWSFSNFDFYPRGCSALFWAPDGSETSIQISMDGASDSDTESKLALSPDATNSDLLNGIAVWTGQTSLPLAIGGPLTVYTRFVLSVTDTAFSPIPLLPAPPPIGAAVNVAPSGGDFNANLQFEASLDQSSWQAAASFFNSQPTDPNCSNCLGSSFTAQFFCLPPENLAPTVSCSESVNPSGNNVPGASGQNEDGFYLLSSEDEEDDPEPPVYVGQADGSAVFGPFPSGSTVKITEAPGAAPKMLRMGGPDSAVAAHILLNSDAHIWAVDSHGAQSEVISCLVPPPPK